MVFRLNFAWWLYSSQSKLKNHRPGSFTIQIAVCSTRVKMTPSMSAKGYCYDNAFMESFFKTLKAEEVYLTEYETMEDVMKSIPTFIDEMYNKKRRHSSLGYVSPEEYEKLADKNLLNKTGIPSFVQVGP
jgi:transposase InsO family protein